MERDSRVSRAAYATASGTPETYPHGWFKPLAFFLNGLGHTLLEETIASDVFQNILTNMNQAIHYVARLRQTDHDDLHKCLVLGMIIWLLFLSRSSIFSV
jgi:hypothetical protein